MYGDMSSMTPPCCSGGPGCSSLEGALQEGGPLWTAAGGTTLQPNNYSVRG